MQRYNGSVIVIIGPTGSGKTGVAIEIAKRCGELFGDGRQGEIISADSRAIYKGMEIGVAKPSREEQDGVRHFGLDLVEPGERYTVFDWKREAEQRIEEIRTRGNVPIVVGGTGLYVDALAYDYQFNDNVKNTCSDRKEMCTNYLILGIKTDAEELRIRLTERVNKMFVQELFDETRRLVEEYGFKNQAMKSNIYQFVWRYLEGEIDLETAKRLSVNDDWHLARRQRTWFRRNQEIKWMSLAEVSAYVLKYIQDEQRK